MVSISIPDFDPCPDEESMNDPRSADFVQLIQPVLQPLFRRSWTIHSESALAGEQTLRRHSRAPLQRIVASRARMGNSVDLVC